MSRERSAPGGGTEGATPGAVGGPQVRLISGTRFWTLGVAALLLQVAFWIWATPGPMLPRSGTRGLSGALSTVALSVAFLFAIPWTVGRAVGFRKPEEGLRAGDARFGASASGGALIVLLPVLFLAGANPDLQAAYPWPGAWAGRSVPNLALWSALYLLYYVAYEFFYRGFVLQLAAARWGIAAGIWVSALLSTFVHVGKPTLELVAALPAGLLFGVLAVRSRSLAYPMALHWLIGVVTDVSVLHHQGLLLRG